MKRLSSAHVSICFSAALLSAALTVCCAWASDPVTSSLNVPSAMTGKVGFDQKIGSSLPPQAFFTNSDGQGMSLRDAMGTTKSAVLALVYYGCPHLCKLTTEGVIQAISSLRLLPDSDFKVFFVSFDPRDTRDTADKARKRALKMLGSPELREAVSFWVGDQKNIDLVTNAVGFRAQWDPQSKEFAHASGLVLLTSQGIVSSYLFGIEYPTRQLQLGLVAAGKGKMGSIVDRFLLFCFHYDPVAGRYSIALLRLMKAAAAITVLSILVFVAILMGQQRRRKQNTKKATFSPV